MKSYLVIFAGLLLSACVDNGYKPVALDSNYGRSVKQVMQAQFLNPQAAANPSKKVSNKLDGQTGQNIMNTYRQGFSQREQVQSVNINLGGSSSGSSGSSSGQ